MTANQVAYANYVESKRSNMAREAETSRHNYQTEKQARSELAETKRHNVKVENHNANALLETKRKNSLDYQINSAKNRETFRHNLAQESETERTNRVYEGIAKQDSQTRAGQLEHAYYQTDKNYESTMSGIYGRELIAQNELKFQERKHEDEMDHKYYNTNAGIFSSLAKGVPNVISTLVGLVGV